MSALFNGQGRQMYRPIGLPESQAWGKHEGHPRKLLHKLNLAQVGFGHEIQSACQVQVGSNHHTLGLGLGSERNMQPDSFYFHFMMRILLFYYSLQGNCFTTFLWQLSTGGHCVFTDVHEYLTVTPKQHFPCKLIKWFNLNNKVSKSINLT